MKPLGFVNNIYRESWRQLITMVLNYEELNQKPPLGAFLIGRDKQRRILARVEKVYYKPVLVQDYNRALAMGQLNEEKADETSVRSINFMHYDLVLLGEIDLDTGDYDAGIRDVPSLMDIQFYLPDKDKLHKIVSAKIPAEEEEEQHPFKIGVLQYGTSDRYTPKEVDIEFNIANFFPKRTAVFGKTGYGKSNLIKTIIVLMNKHYTNVGQLILDVNGEYGFDETGTDQGLISVLGERVVVYTNRDVETSIEGQIKPIRFNFYDEPQLGAQLRCARIMDRQPPIYINELAETPNDEILRKRENISLKAAWWCALHSIGFEVPAKEKYRYWLPTQKKWRENNPDKVSEKGNVLGIENVVEYVEWCRENTDSYGSDTVSNMLRYAGQFRFLKELHSPEATTNFFDSVQADIEAGKIVIVDLSSLNPTLMLMVSNRVAYNIFCKAQDDFLKVAEKRLKTLIFVEEAHNLLADDDRGAIFKRVGREGRKYGIGLVYSTQRPGSIVEDILTQTENFFVMHIGSENDANVLKKAKTAFGSPISEFILSEPAVGFTFVYSEPYQPYVLSCQVDKFEDVVQRIRDKDKAEQPSQAEPQLAGSNHEATVAVQQERRTLE